METLIATSNKPTTFEEFLVWEPNDGLKYEWNDGELIQFTGMNKNQVFIYQVLNKLFNQKEMWKVGTLVAEYDTMLSGIQMRRPDIAYLTDEQIALTKRGEDVIPEFVIEIISGSDNFYKVEEKITEYFKAGVKVVWNIIPDEQMVQVYTSRRNVKICLENDLCSAAPVLPDFEISVDTLFA
ncbi:MAG: Uma2 family endonuclease [Spirosomaceae bacterium]|nr:Uma2 family endonuclease [Spirosomataceae bacterium]